MKVRDPGVLREARLAVGYSQRNLAALAHCTQATISGLENGWIEATSAELARSLARWLKQDVTALFQEETRQVRPRTLNALGSTRATRATRRRAAS